MVRSKFMGTDGVYKMKYWIWCSLLFSLCLSTPAIAKTQWKSTQISHFSFRYPQQWKHVVEPIIATAPQDLKMLEKAHGISYKGVIRIHFSSPGKAFANIQPHGWQPSSDIAGLAYPKRSLITMRIKSIEGLSALRQTFQHELSHIIIAQATNDHPVPLWFNEGIAMILSKDFGDFDRFVMLASARIGGKLPRLSQLKFRFPRNPGARKLAYALSFDAVLFLYKQDPMMLSSILKHLRAGKSFTQATKQALGNSWVSINKKWRKSLALRYGWLPLIANEGTIWLLAVFLFFLAYTKIKKQRRLQFAAMEEHEYIEEEHECPEKNDLIVLPSSVQ